MAKKSRQRARSTRSRSGSTAKRARLKRFRGSKDDPVVFMFRPTHYEVVESDKLKEWEQMMAKYVGLDVALASKSSQRLQWIVPGGGGATNSSSAGAGWDDCDYRGGR